NTFSITTAMNHSAAVVDGKGCDLQTVDPKSVEGALTLRSIIWADQLGRLALLDGAIQVASDLPIEVEPLDAADFLQRELATSAEGVATVVYHSVFMQYVDEAGRKRLEAAVAGARQRASPRAPGSRLRPEAGPPAE